MRAGREIAGSRQAQHLLVVGEQVVEVRKGGRDPVADRRGLLTGREQVGGGDDATVAGEGQDLRRLHPTHELGGAEMQVRRLRNRVVWRIRGAEGAIRAHDVERRARAVGANREHARRGLDVVAAAQQRRLDAGCGEQRDQRVAECVRADRARTLDGGAELGERDRGAAGGARRGHPDLLDELAALTLGDRLDRTDEHVKDVDAERDRSHFPTHGAALWVVP